MIRTLALGAVLATAGLAHAEAPLPAYPPGTPMVITTPNLAAPLNLKPLGPIALRYANAPAPLPRGVARTAIERRDGGVSGGIGVLCGIQPSADTSGVGAARGYDNDGRFVGAKLGFSF